MPLWRLLTDPLVRRYLCDDREMTRDEVATMLADNIAHWPSGMGLWLINEGETAIGCVAIHPVAPAMVSFCPKLAGEVEPTIALKPASWGRGLAREVLAAVLDYGFERLELDHITAIVDQPNQASHGLMARVGFVPTEAMPGPHYQLQLYRLDRNAFTARPPQH